MPQAQDIFFRSFRLDLANERLWRRAQEVTLRPKTFAVLRYLLEHADRLITKEELLDTVWPDTSVSDVVPLVCIRELRKALGDEAGTPRFIETVPRRGYRFIAPVSTTPFPLRNGFSVSGANSKVHAGPTRLPSQGSRLPLVARDAEIEQLRQRLTSALEGKRQVVFVTGETGIGKTTVVEAFLERALPKTPVWLARGQCIEHYGGGEAYLPLLDALSRLCRDPQHERFLALLGQYAPTWLLQMPWLVSVPDLEALHRRATSATKERMLREIAEALEALTTQTPLVLFLEDLQWSDASTLDFLSFVARRHELARLLLIGSYRPEELATTHSPLKAVVEELLVHKQCEELLLPPLPETAITAYLSERFGGSWYCAPLRELGRVIHQRAEGNPLFMMNVVDYLVEEEVLVKREGDWELREAIEKISPGIPENLRRVIRKQLERLSVEEQAVLEVGSVVGAEFSIAAVTAGLAEEGVAVEQYCEALARRQRFLRPMGVEILPNGVVTAHYAFTHAFYQSVLYERVAVGRRVRFHQQIGEWMETVYRNQEGERAAELAVHFAEGRDYHKAVRYLRHAAFQASRRYASREALSLVTKGLELLKQLPDTSERAREELVLQLVLGRALQYRGSAALEVERAYTRAKDLCGQEGDSSTLFWVLMGLFDFHISRGELVMAQEVGEELLVLAQGGQTPELRVWAHGVLGVAFMSRGELVSARSHLEEGLTLYSPEAHSPTIGAVCLVNLSHLLWALGYRDQAFQHLTKAFHIAREHANSFSVLYALVSAAMLHWFNRGQQTVLEHAEQAIANAPEQEFRDWGAMAMILQGGVLTQGGQVIKGLLQMRQGLATLREREIYISLPMYLTLFAEVLGSVGQAEEGLVAVGEAISLAEKLQFATPLLAELYRVKGELMLRKLTILPT